MNTKELSGKIRQVADECDNSRQQQCVKSVLYGLLSAIAGRAEETLMDHTCEFSRQMIRQIERQRFASHANRN